MLTVVIYVVVTLIIAAALFALEGRCTDLYVLARPDLTQSAPGQDYRTTPVMV